MALIFLLPAVIADKSPTISHKLPVTVNVGYNAIHINTGNLLVNSSGMLVSSYSILQFDGKSW